MAQLKFSERLIKSTAEKYLSNFIGQKIDSQLINVIRSGMLTQLRKLIPDDYKIDVHQNMIMPHNILVSITMRDGINYKSLDLSLPGSEPELVTQIIDEISKYNIDEVLGRI